MFKSVIGKIKSLFSAKEKDPEDVKMMRFAKKRTILESIYTSLTIILTVFVIYQLNLLSGVKDYLFPKDHIALIKIHGVISAGSSANAENAIEGLTDAFENKHSKAIVLDINSGGGSPYQSERIWSEINYLKNKHNKKVYAVIQDMGASAAYQIAVSSDKIILGKSSIVGSIGVRMDSYDTTKLIEKIGIDDRSLFSGENKLALSYTQPLKEEQRAFYQALLENLHNQFISNVREGRKGKIKEGKDTYSGYVWSGEEAIKLGLADSLGDLNTLKRELKISNVKNYTVSQDGFGSLFKSSFNSAGQSIGQGISNAFSEEVGTNNLSLK